MVLIFVVGLLVGGGLTTVTLLKVFSKRTVTLLATVGILIPGCVIGLGSAAYVIGLSATQEGAVGGYKQFKNGSLVSADVLRIECSQDGPCSHEDTYCDPYTDWVIESYTDADGKSQSRIVPVTKYHSCPQMTEEFSFTVTDNFGNVYPIALNIFAQDPVPWRNHGVDMSGSDRVPRGIPERWQRIKDNIAAGNADPVTVLSTYDNYILGSEKTILKEYSDDIAQLRQAQLLPDHTANLSDPIRGGFNADKVNFVCMAPPPSAAIWQQTVMKFNAGLGMQQQGDLHLVILRASCLKDISPGRYAQALKAYWLNELGKNAIAKNGIILVLGVDDSASSVQWTEAGTGMPVGNDGMFHQLRTKLPGTPLSTERLFGNTRATVHVQADKKTPIYTIGNGIIPQIIMVEQPFKRACMGCEGEEDKGSQGFVYLKTEIPLEGWPLVLTIFVYLIVFAAVWIATIAGYVFLAGDQPFRRVRSTPHSRHYYSHGW